MTSGQATVPGEVRARSATISVTGLGGMLLKLSKTDNFHRLTLSRGEFNSITIYSAAYAAIFVFGKAKVVMFSGFRQ